MASVYRWLWCKGIGMSLTLWLICSAAWFAFTWPDGVASVGLWLVVSIVWWKVVFWFWVGREFVRWLSR